MEFFIIYLFVMVEKIAALFDKGYMVMLISLIMVGVCIFIAGLSTAGEENQSVAEQLKKPVYKTVLRLSKWGAIVGLVFGVIASVMPNQKELAIIVGSGVTYNVITSEPAKRIGGKSLQLLEQQIDKALKDETVIPEKIKEAVVEKIEGKAL